MEWLGLLIVIIILGALFGGNSLGETIRSGCLVVIVILLVLLVFFVLSFTWKGL